VYLENFSGREIGRAGKAERIEKAERAERIGRNGCAEIINKFFFGL